MLTKIGALNKETLLKTSHLKPLGDDDAGGAPIVVGCTMIDMHVSTRIDQHFKVSFFALLIFLDLLFMASLNESRGAKKKRPTFFFCASKQGFSARARAHFSQLFPFTIPAVPQLNRYSTIELCCKSRGVRKFDGLWDMRNPHQH